MLFRMISAQLVSTINVHQSSDGRFEVSNPRSYWWLPTIKDIVEMGLLELEIGSRFSSRRKGLHSLCSSELPFACDEKENSPLSTHFQTTLPTTSSTQWAGEHMWDDTLGHDPVKVRFTNSNTQTSNTLKILRVLWERPPFLTFPFFSNSGTQDRH